MMKNKVPIFAHRGASAEAIENSFSAFNRALKHGVDGIEVDIQQSKDGQLFVFHDINLIRLVGVNRFIHDCESKELAGYKLGIKWYSRLFSKHRIPKFEPFVQWANEKDVPINLELKESLLLDTTSLENMLQTVQLPVGSHFSSFHEDLLKIVKAIRPEFQTALIVTKKFDWQSLGELQHIDVVHANKKYYKKRFLKACDEAKKPIRYYGIDGTEPYIKNPHPAVIGWITDYPKTVALVQNIQ